MTSLATRVLRTIADVLVLTLAYWLAFFVRFEGDLPYLWLKRAAFTVPYVIALQYLLLSLADVPRFSWRHIGLREVTRIFVALSVAALALLLLRFVSTAVRPSFGYALYAYLPLGVIFADAVLAFLGISGIRVLRRLQTERWEASHRDGGVRQVPTMLIGAGSAGLAVARELAARPDLGLRAVGILDDDVTKHGALVHGLPVLGSTADLARLCKKQKAEQVLITIAHASGGAIRRIRELAQAAGLPTKIIPALHELVSGTVSVTAIRDIALEDLLGRDPVALDLEAIASMVRGRTVLVTGAGGSIGSELCRQLCRFEPAALILVERGENNLFEIHRELARRHPTLKVVPRLADVSDRPTMERIFADARPTFVLHAAAHKHVPMLEWNPLEAVKNNLRGTRTVADVAHAHGTAVFVLISTDKAVKPSSIMGATKRAAETYVQSLATRSKTKFVAVRFGNVLGSAGSVVPVFREQLARGGPLTVTHPEMTRYFMTIPEACQLVLQAASMGAGSEVFVLDMGEPVKIVDLAHDLIRLSGLEPGVDVEVAFTGIRPGEKLHEELTSSAELVDTTRHPKVRIARQAAPDFIDTAAQVDGVINAAINDDLDETLRRLRALVPDFQGQGAEAAAPTAPARSPLPTA